jgi:AGZA family xanthine/uracil permease-like MFS transporter
MMPLTYSIAYGIAIGFIAYVIIKALSGKTEALNPGSVGIAIVSVVFFYFA